MTHRDFNKVKNIRATFTYKGEERECYSDGGIVRNDEFTYFLDKDTDNPDNDKDPYFEINIDTEWNEQKQGYDIYPRGYVNHFASTNNCDPDWTSHDVKIEFLY